MVIVTQPFIVKSGKYINNECYPERCVLFKLSTEKSFKLHQEMRFLLR